MNFPEFYTTLADKNTPELARIISCFGNIYKIAIASGEKTARVSGKFAHEAISNLGFPVVGDYVLARKIDNGDDVIYKVLTRKSIFSRKAAGTSNTIQPICANIDYVFICMSLNKDFNLRRLERYISLSWDSGATPVVVLTKSDLHDDASSKVIEVETVALGVDVIVTSSIDDVGFDKLKSYLKKDKTVSFLGSSGVGKSTLINGLLGKKLIATKEIRMDDDKGKHTTTTRNLFYLENGSAVIDTPGMRELGFDGGESSHTFSDIEAFAKNCKFSDCKHESEPKCAVKRAIESGLLDQSRLDSYNKFMREASYDGLKGKQLEKAKLDIMFSEIGGMKNVKNFIKENDKRK